MPPERLTVKLFNVTAGSVVAAVPAENEVGGGSAAEAATGRGNGGR